MKKLYYKFPCIKVCTRNELAEQINAHTEVICLEGEILDELYRKLKDEINKNQRRKRNHGLMGVSLLLLGLYLLNPIFIATSLVNVLAASSIGLSNNRDFKEYSVAIFKDSFDNKRLLMIYEKVYDGPSDSIEGFDDYFFIRNLGNSCNCRQRLKNRDFDEETSRYYCPRCHHYTVSRIPLG